jgi:nicotinamide mononucleotide adenylyltransferase|tara:strand:- start:208 stop:549 length:342 start_codon:yes stop_codon:yes gene_type:complete
MKYSLFIGRWQPWHKGHRWLIDQRLNEGLNVCIAIRDVKKDKSNPFSPSEIKENLEKELFELIDSKRVKVIIMPDIESINYGRGVGYDIIEHKPPKDIKKISATAIRKKLFSD